LSGHGWSRAWAIAFWARLQEGERASESLAMLMAHSTGPNLFCTHPAGNSWVDVTRSGGRAKEAVLRAKLDGEHRLRPPKGQKIASVRPAAGTLEPGADGTVPVQVKAGRRYRVAFS
jgi:alpha-L-fucosidase 2